MLQGPPSAAHGPTSLHRFQWCQPPDRDGRHVAGTLCGTASRDCHWLNQKCLQSFLATGGPGGYSLLRLDITVEDDRTRLGDRGKTLAFEGSFLLLLLSVYIQKHAKLLRCIVYLLVCDGLWKSSLYTASRTVSVLSGDPDDVLVLSCHHVHCG